MHIVAGHITLEPQKRESYLAGCVASSNGHAGSWLSRLRHTADLIDPGRVNVFERWEPRAGKAPHEPAGSSTYGTTMPEGLIRQSR